MSPTKLVIQALTVLALAAPAAFAEPAVPAAPEKTPAAASQPADEVAPSQDAAPADEAAPAEDATAADEAAPAEDAASAAAATSEPAATSAETAAPDATAQAQDGTATPSEPLAGAPSETSAQSPQAQPLPGGTEAAAPAAGSPAADLAGNASDSQPPLGAVGYDSQGRRGRIHIVVPGDTLWDISDAYLGTPWVWPSIWHDNSNIANPHWIYPGDRIWITPTEMRKVSAEEAARLLSNQPPEPAAPEVTQEAPKPETKEPAPVPAETDRGSVIVSSRESSGLITPSQLDAAASIVGRVPERVLVAQEDDVYIGLGEGDVSVGDQLTVFRTEEKVFDPDTGMLLGYHVDILGWVEVEETYPETSKATIRMSTGEIQEGDRLMRRDPLPQKIALQPSPAGVEGRISFFPQHRVVIGSLDFVYLNRGSTDGLEVGSPLEVYRSGYEADDEARGQEVVVPDRVIAKLVVVRAEPETAVAMVMGAKTELELGDHFRGANL